MVTTFFDESGWSAESRSSAESSRFSEDEKESFAGRTRESSQTGRRRKKVVPTPKNVFADDRAGPGFGKLLDDGQTETGAS